jgi:hypothetical protein
MAFRVPTPNVSVVDLTARLNKGVRHFIFFLKLFQWIFYRLNMKKFAQQSKKLQMAQ